jgi:hypothetical protein
MESNRFELLGLGVEEGRLEVNHIPRSRMADLRRRIKIQSRYKENKRDITI